MKITMNFSLSDDDTSRYTDLSDLWSSKLHCAFGAN